ncbi:DUF3073 domain-containing protein [Kitasatospora purpeofusca]|uniref:DUF3073 domain-containing protein n=1 Tax=Kitasatospora purpeofusca TaxID=67352 RepID=A0ABZ1U388_9ACTN|nr:DUF3073 domain-containing protein [Kitasatospora purpeofusca]MCX4753852.1 DUF3073 domain-containing protein [Kitasatospora purpeofusca]WSR33323.1 DUF3073 domain-containing protein [Kitasatospora purpeofusca]WSR41394.1 DUF3073 domain-containing protein [Kitasatospora purpeofusca]WTA52734.1 DUF3073 domain-containing protein [Kitasatospora purpeofusca]BEK66975.1 DUF3073 domain-containing protein [Kitasatospora purpeofusca]
MGRGRAKAKQTKVARELKYNSGGFDANRLSSELGVSPSTSPIEPEPIEEDEEDDDDPYAEYAARYADDDEDDDAESGTGPSQARRRA